MILQRNLIYICREQHQIKINLNQAAFKKLQACISVGCNAQDYFLSHVGMRIQVKYDDGKKRGLNSVSTTMNDFEGR